MTTLCSMNQHGNLELKMVVSVFLECWLFAHVCREMTLEGKTGTTNPMCHDSYLECYLVDTNDIMFGA